MPAKGDSSVMFEHTGCIGEHMRLAVEVVHEVEELSVSGAVDAWVEFRGHEPEDDDRVVVGGMTGHGTPTTVEDSHFLTKIEREVISRFGYKTAFSIHFFFVHHIKITINLPYCDPKLVYNNITKINYTLKDCVVSS